MHTKIANVSNYIAALFLFTFGVTYLLKPSFMPYHSEALSLGWNELEQNTQVLILALMRVVSGGYIAGAVVMIILQNKFSTYKLSWIPAIILICGLIEGLITLYGTMLVRLNSPGKPPIELGALGVILVVVGYVFNRKSLSKAR